jgi:hypothetical protein
VNAFVLNRFKPVLVVVGWATCLATLTIGIMFQGLLLPNAFELSPESFGSSSLLFWIFYLGSFAICALASMVIFDFSQSVVSFFFAFLLNALIIFFVLVLPDLIGIVQPPGALQEPSVTFVFDALIPVSLFVGLAGTIAGSAISERLF